jgi:hypothetical protein
MYSGVEKGRKRKYPKYTGANAQNDDFYCKNQYSVLLFHTNPLPLTILNNVSMGVVVIGGLLSSTLGRQR